MKPADDDAAPETLAVGPARFVRDDAARAIAVPPDGAPPAGALAVLAEGLAVVPGRGDRPVYRAAPSGALAVPTGRVFVRFAAGTAAREQTHALAAAGYAIDDLPGWAPHVAWVRAASGSVAEALARLGELGPGDRRPCEEVLGLLKGR